MTIKPQDIFGSAAPKTVLNKPQMQVVYKATSTSYSVVVTERAAEFNSVLVNEIPGASLGSNGVTLPAGIYDIFTRIVTRGYLFGVPIWIEDGSSNILSDVFTSYPNPGHSEIHTRLVLTSTTTIYIKEDSRYDSGLSYTTAVGEVLNTLIITQLDASIKTPVIINDKLYPLPGNTMVTGNIHGLEYAKTGANQITVQPGICMDSTNNEVLSLSTATALTIGTTINQVYNIFLCKETSGGAMVLEYDTDVNGANISSDKDAIRWLGFVLTDSSGDIYDFYYFDDTMEFTIAGGVDIESGNISTTAHVPSYATAISGWPEGRIDSIALWGQATGGENLLIYAVPDGTNNEYSLLGTISSGEYRGTSLTMIPLDMPVRAYNTSNDLGTIGVKRIKVRR